MTWWNLCAQSNSGVCFWPSEALLTNTVTWLFRYYMWKYSSSCTLVLKYCGLHSIFCLHQPWIPPYWWVARHCFAGIGLKRLVTFAATWNECPTMKRNPFQATCRPQCRSWQLPVVVCVMWKPLSALSHLACNPVYLFETLPFPTVLSKGQQRATNMHPTLLVCKSKCSEETVALFFCPVAELWPSKLVCCLPSTNHISWVPCAISGWLPLWHCTAWTS